MIASTATIILVETIYRALCGITAGLKAWIYEAKRDPNM